MEAQEVGLAEKKSECEPRAKGWETLAGSDDKGLVGHAEEFGLISLSFVSLISEKGSQQRNLKVIRVTFTSITTSVVWKINSGEGGLIEERRTDKTLS